MRPFNLQSWGISADFDISAGDLDYRLYKLQRGKLCINMFHLYYGLRLPLCEEINGILSGLGVCVAQLLPNSVGVLVGFVILCVLYKVRCNLAGFLHFLARGWGRITWCNSVPRLHTFSRR